MNTIFGNSLNKIDSILSRNEHPSSSVRVFNKGNNDSILNESATLPIRYETDKTLMAYDRNFIVENYGENDYSFDVVKIGTHPDFDDLDHSNYLMHHCVSMFVDIKGSTKLIDKYSISEVRLIKDTILTLIINVVSQFGGHVQRLQGDGVFILFARRDKSHINSIINALNASSLLAQFISVDLADIFKKNNINPLRIRAGIDYGDKDKVIWSYYGIPGCDELTTTSLHTDMAAKLQAKAMDNCIMIGSNIANELDLTKEYISHYYAKDGSLEEVFHVTSTLTYKFYVFEWKKYLSKHPNFKLLLSNVIRYDKPKLYIKCEYELNDITTEYHPNSKGIPKTSTINFTLYENGNLYFRKNFEEIKWTIFNTGNEAKQDNCVEQEVDKASKNQNNCTTHAKYLGLHKIQCKLLRNNSENINIEFPVIVY